MQACGGDQKAPDAKEVDKSDTAPPAASVKTIVFFGNSITAGYGLDPAQAFTAGSL